MLSKIEIQKELTQSKDDLVSFIRSIDDSTFRHKISLDQWNCAEQIYHLNVSAKSSLLPYQLPKFIVKLLFGTPKRVGYSYEALETYYESKLNKGAKASGKYAAIHAANNHSKEELARQLNSTYEKLTRTMLQCTESDLDHCQVPHPLLGKISLRELLYFTIFHSLHHLKSMQKIQLSKELLT